jgi:hypothetical protein
MAAQILSLAGFMAVWFAFFVYAGCELPRSIGGAFAFYFLLPGIASLPARYKEFTAVLWCIVLTLSGVTALNYLFWLSPVVFENHHPLVQMYLITTPFMMIYGGFFGTLFAFLIPKTPQNVVNFYPFARLLCFHWMLTTYAIVSGMVTFKSAGLDNVFQLTFQAGLGALVLGTLVLLWKLRRFTPQMLRGAVRQTLKLPLDPIRFKKRVVLWTVVLMFFSFSAEHLRKYWILWAECVGFLVLFVAVIAKFGEVLCINTSQQPGESSEFLLPGMRTRGLILLFLATFIIFMVVNVLIMIYL